MWTFRFSWQNCDYSAQTVVWKKISSKLTIWRFVTPWCIFDILTSSDFNETALIDHTVFNGGVVGLVGLSKVCLFERARFFWDTNYVFRMVLSTTPLPNYIHAHFPIDEFTTLPSHCNIMFDNCLVRNKRTYKLIKVYVYRNTEIQELIKVGIYSLIPRWSTCCPGWPASGSRPRRTSCTRRWVGG